MVRLNPPATNVCRTHQNRESHLNKRDRLLCKMSFSTGYTNSGFYSTSTRVWRLRPDEQAISSYDNRPVRNFWLLVGLEKPACAGAQSSRETRCQSWPRCRAWSLPPWPSNYLGDMPFVPATQYRASSTFKKYSNTETETDVRNLSEFGIRATRGNVARHDRAHAR